LIAIISDIHSNPQALSAVLSDMKNYSVTDIFCLGDLVNYGPEPNETISMLLNHGVKSIMGNHDLSVADPVNGLSYISTSKELLQQYTLDIIEERHRKYLETLPLSLSAYDCFFVHSRPPNMLNGHIRRHLETRGFHQSMDTTGKRLCFVGHTHVDVVYSGVPSADRDFTYTPIQPSPVEKMGLASESYTESELHLYPETRYIINVGSVGFHRGGKPFASYCLYDPQDERLLFRHVYYDLPKLLANLKARNLPTHIEDYLASYLPLGGPQRI